MKVSKENTVIAKTDTVIAVEADAVNAATEEGFGKFEDAKQLLRAYENLEREFTKKSQRLKELENGASMASGRRAEPESEASTPCYLKGGWHDAVDNFVKQNPGSREFADEIAAFIVSDPKVAASPYALELAYMNVLKERFVAPEKLVADEAYLDKYVLNNNAVKLRVISDYLNQLQKTGVPPVISGESGTIFLTPPKRPRTIREASDLAEKYFKK